MRSLILGLLLVTLAFAGCMSGEDDPEPTTSSSTTSTSQSSTTTTSGSTTTSSGTTTASENRAPSLVITLASNQSANGTAPLNVTFLLDGTDADGDSLSWTLSFGDNSADASGEDLPAEVNHTFATVGNYTILFTVTDGTATVNATYAVQALASGGGNYPAPIVFSGESARYGLLGCGSGTPGFATYHDFDVALAGAWKYKASPSNMVTEWWVGDSSSTDAGAEGVIPADHDNVAVCPAGTSGVAYPAAAYTLTLYHPDSPAPA